MNGMSNFPDNFFDLAIVDPPYGINAPNMQMGAGAPSRGRKSSTAVDLKKERLNSGGGKLKNCLLNKSSFAWDSSRPDESYFQELFRISKNQIIWGGNYFPLPTTRCVVVWDKKQPWENFSQVEIAWTSFDRPALLFSLSNTTGSNLEKKIHPTQKPVKLYKWLLTKFAKQGDKIIDTHMGSQSSRIAAYDLGFDYWGWELDPSYFNEGNKRFSLFKVNQKLF